MKSCAGADKTGRLQARGWWAHPQCRPLTNKGTLNVTLVDHGRRQDVPSADNGLLHIKDCDGGSRACHLQVDLKKVSQVGNVLKQVVVCLDLLAQAIQYCSR